MSTFVNRGAIFARSLQGEITLTVPLIFYFTIYLNIVAIAPVITVPEKQAHTIQSIGLSQLYNYSTRTKLKQFINHKRNQSINQIEY